jgi:hypothetical protein
VQRRGSFVPINSQATSLTNLTLHQLAIVACFVFWREICYPAFSDFCNKICHYRTHAVQQRAWVIPVLRLISRCIRAARHPDQHGRSIYLGFASTHRIVATPWSLDSSNEELFIAIHVLTRKTSHSAQMIA